MKTMICNLPNDLIEEIISRIPLKYMKAVRLTCKSWNSLSQNESFAKMHISKAATTRREANEIIMIEATSHNLYLMSVLVDEFDPFIELKGELSFLDDQSISISKVFHHEGLLLCILKDVTRIVVWNPYLGQTRWINLRYSHHPEESDHFNYALGYEDKKSCRSVRFLRFVDYFYKEPEMQFFWYEIYDFDSGLWTTLDVNPYWGIDPACQSVSIKGNSYWCAGHRSLARDYREDHIICFDFTRQRFGSLLPLPVDTTNYGIVILSCVKEEKLAALCRSNTSYNYEIWITTNIKAELVSWSKFLIIDKTLQLGLPRSFLIDEEKKVLMCFGIDYEFDSDYDCCYRIPYFKITGEASCLRRLDIGVNQKDKYSMFHMCSSYVPTFVQIKNPARGKRTEQTSSEKRLFDQNRSRLHEIEKLIQEKKVLS